MTFPLKKIHSDALPRVVWHLCRLQRLRMQYPFLLTDRAVWNFHFYLFRESRPPDTALGQCSALNNPLVTLVQSLQNIFLQFCRNDQSTLKQQESLLHCQFISDCPEWFQCWTPLCFFRPVWLCEIHHLVADVVFCLFDSDFLQALVSHRESLYDKANEHVSIDFFIWRSCSAGTPPGACDRASAVMRFFPAVCFIW